MTLPHGELKERRARVLESFAAEKIDSLIVSALPNVRYLTGFTGSNGLLVLAPGVATLYTDPRYALQAPTESDCKVQVVKKGTLHASAVKHFQRARWKRIGFEASRTYYTQYEVLKEGLKLGAQLQPTKSLVERVRMVKSPLEIALIRESVTTNSQAFEAAIRKIKPRITEADLAREIEHQMGRLGAEKPSFDTIVAVGPHSAMVHASPGSTLLGTDQLLLIDMGAMQAGYASDMTRTLHIGSPRPKARKLYKAVLESQLAAIDAVRDGVTAAAVDRRARSVLKEHGLDSYFVHSTGHGLGLEIHEAPKLGKGDKTRLQAGMAITIEPGAYIEGFGGVRIEDTILVTKTGCEVLTPTSKEMIIIE